jgi:hypothetical protein
MATAATTEETFDVGDRVILQGLEKAAHLNLAHGTVASTLAKGRHYVDIDLISKDQKRINVKPANLHKEPPITTSKRRAACQGGSLVETEGRALSFALDSMRLCVATTFVCDEQVQTHEDIQELKESESGFLKQNRLTASAWSFWSDGRGFRTSNPKGVYEELREYIRVSLPESNGGLETLKSGFPSYQLVYDAVDDFEAIKGWNCRVTGDFYIVGGESEGTFLVPTTNLNAVYQCVGTKNPIPFDGDYPRPVCMHLTMIPWYGRLVYDGVLTPPAGYARPPMVDPEVAKQLRESVEKAKAEGRVISRLRQLEVEGGSRKGLHDRIERNESSVPVEQSKPTPEEDSLVKKIGSFERVDGEPFDEKPGTLWVFRRFGYTEVENPNHVGIILAGAQAIAPFECLALIPTSIDILKALLKNTCQRGKRPIVVGIDDNTCCDRVKFLLKSLGDMEVFYYPPPTPEETMASMSLEDHQQDRRR